MSRRSGSGCPGTPSDGWRARAGGSDSHRGRSWCTAAPSVGTASRGPGCSWADRAHAWAAPPPAYAHRLLEDAPAPVEVLVPHGSAARSRLLWRFVHERPGARDSRCTGSPPRILVPDTVLDLCEGGSPRELEDLVTRAVQNRLTTPRNLQRALDRRERHSRRRLLTELLLEVAEGAESPLELRYLRDVERRHRLPDGKRQRRTSTPGRRDVIYRSTARRRARWPAAWARAVPRHGAGQRGLLEELTTMRFGFGDVAGSPCLVAAQVAQCWEARLDGSFRRCRLPDPLLRTVRI